MNAELLALADKRAALSADLEKVQTELDQADLRIKELESRLAAQSPEPVACIRLRPYEIQSGLDRVRWAEGLIRQLPDNHDGRNAWLANYAGDKHDADKIRFTAQADYEQRIRSALVNVPMSASDGAHPHRRGDGMSNGNFTNGSLVFRIWRFDGGCEILAKFQYRNDAEDFAQLCVDRDTANGANKDNTFFYLAVCDRETFAKAFAASNTGGHHG